MAIVQNFEAISDKFNVCVICISVVNASQFGVE
jgi:hypothetical protein